MTNEQLNIPPSYPSSAYLAIDVGTHAVKVALVSESGEIGEVCHRPIGLTRVDSRCVEQNPQEILDALTQGVQSVLSIATAPIFAAGLAIQRSTVLAWDKKTGRAVSDALSWQDTRGYEQIIPLRAKRLSIESRSGLVLSPHYGATKIHLLQQRYSAENICISPLVSYLLFNLLEDPKVTCDESNAGRTQLWNLNLRQWDNTLCSFFDIQVDCLPSVQPVISHFGSLNKQLTRGKNIVLEAVAGDQNAALMGVLPPFISQSSSLVVNLGSGAFVLGMVGEDSEKPQGLLHSIAFSDQKYCQKILEGTVNGAGSALTWFSQSQEVIGLGGEPWLLQQLHTWLADPSIESVQFYNGVGGLASPFWQSGVESFFKPVVASVSGKAVAIVESIVFLLVINIKKIRQANTRFDSIYVSGGVARFDGLCQRLSDLLQCQVIRSREHETTILGIARLASEFAIPVAKVDRCVFKPVHNHALLMKYRAYVEMIKMTMVKYVAHRGYAEKYPENSLKAIEEALKQGVDAVEFDIQMSSDGIPVVFHDYELERLARREGVVSKLSFSELQTLSVHEPERFGEEFFPTLIPSLKMIAELVAEYPKAFIFAEIKSEIFEHFSREQSLKKIWEILKPISSQCFIISYDLEVLRLVQAQGLCPVGWVLSAYTQDEYQQVKENPVDILITNRKRFPPIEQNLWSGPWEWFAYEVSDKSMLDDCLSRGVRWIESQDAVGLLSYGY